MSTPADKVAQYIKLRDHKKAAQDEFDRSLERVVKAMEKLEGELLMYLQETGANSLACDAGTVYRNMQVSCSIDDPAAFLAFVRESDEWDALDLKANKTFVRELLDKHGSTPPGVKVSTINKIGVRRS